MTKLNLGSGGGGGGGDGGNRGEGIPTAIPECPFSSDIFIGTADDGVGTMALNSTEPTNSSASSRTYSSILRDNSEPCTTHIPLVTGAEEIGGGGAGGAGMANGEEVCCWGGGSFFARLDN